MFKGCKDERFIGSTALLLLLILVHFKISKVVLI